MRARLAIAVALAASFTLPVTAMAKPRRKTPAGDKDDARTLLASGLKLFAAKDYLGALVVFRDAYDRFPSPKILLNIGTTLKALGRFAEAANVYQRYLDAPDSEASKTSEVTKVLAELDTKVGAVDLSVKPASAEIQLGTDEWIPSNGGARYRVPAGRVTIRARADGHEPAEKSYDAIAGKLEIVGLVLAPVVATPLPVPEPSEPQHVISGVAFPAEPAERPPSKLAAFAYALVDVAHAGGAARVGASYEVLPRLAAEAAALIGPSSGGYVGARYAILGGRYRPVVAVGAPIFISNGARVGVRAAAAFELVVNRHLSVVAEVGGERLINAEMNYAETLFIPALGVTGRL